MVRGICWRTRRPVGTFRRLVRRPPSRSTRSSRYHLRVSDTWPPPGPKKPAPLLEHVRDVWTRHGIQSTCMAAIWRNDFGLELRVLHGDELIESRLSRVGEAPLLLIADQLKANLMEDGWFGGPKRDGRGITSSRPNLFDPFCGNRTEYSLAAGGIIESRAFA